MVKVYNPRFPSFDAETQTGIVIDAISVLMGDYHYLRKKAAVLLLKAFLPKEVWRGILVEEQEVAVFSRNDSRVRAWRKSVFDRDSHACKGCGSTEDLHAHHILKWSEYPAGRIDINNGITLCVDCHADEHIEERNVILAHKKKGVKEVEQKR